MYFPGDSTRLEVDTPFLSSEEFTLDVWIRPDTMVAYSRIIFRPEDYAGWGNSAWAIRYEANNLITARFTQVGGGDNVIALDTPLELGKWYHLIYEVAAENSVFQLSDADDQVIEAKESPVTAKPINTTAPLRIGNAANVTGSPDWHDRSFRGVMDEFNFYNYPAAGLATDVPGEIGAVPVEFGLAQNFPNPFNPTTQIVFSLPKEDAVKLVVFDILGRKVKTLIDQKMAGGRHTIHWDGTDQQGQLVTSGVYFYRLQSVDQTRIRKMVFIK